MRFSNQKRSSVHTTNYRVAVRSDLFDEEHAATDYLCTRGTGYDSGGDGKCVRTTERASAGEIGAISGRVEKSVLFDNGEVIHLS